MSEYAPPSRPDPDLVGFDWWAFAAALMLGSATGLGLYATWRAHR